MTSLADFRASYPQYDDMPDAVLASSLYSKFYADIPREEFNKRIGLVAAPVTPEKATPFSAKDTALSFGQSVIGVGKAVTDVFGAGNVASEKLESWQKGLGESITPERQAEMERRQRLEEQASKSGSMVNEISTYLGGVAEAPLISLAQGLGSIIPYVGTSVVGAVAGLGRATLLALNTVVGAVQGAGTIKGSVYESVEKELVKSGMSEKDAKEKASKAQEYLGPNFLNIAGGAALGAVAARTGIEPTLIKGGAAGASERLLPRVGSSVLKEIPAEAGQGGQEQYAQNVALQREGFNVPSFQGVAGAAARDAAVAGLTAGAVGAVRGPSRPVADPAMVKEMDDDQARIEQELAAGTTTAPPVVPAPPTPEVPVPPTPEVPTPALLVPEDKAREILQSVVDTQGGLANNATIYSVQEAYKKITNEYAPTPIVVDVLKGSAPPAPAPVMPAPVPQLPQGEADATILAKQPASGEGVPIPVPGADTRGALPADAKPTGVGDVGGVINPPDVGTAAKPPALASTVQEVKPPAIAPKLQENLLKFVESYKATPRAYGGPMAFQTVQTIRNYIKNLGGSFEGLTSRNDLNEAKIPKLFDALQTLVNTKITPPDITTAPTLVDTPPADTTPATPVEVKPPNRINEINEFIYDFVASPAKYLGEKAFATSENIKKYLQDVQVETTGLVSRNDTYEVKAQKYFAALDKAMVQIAPQRTSSASLEDAVQDMGFEETPTGFKLGSYVYDLRDDSFTLKNVITGEERNVPLSHANPEQAEQNTPIRLEATSRIPDNLHPLFNQYDEGKLAPEKLRQAVIQQVRQAAIEDVSAKNAVAPTEAPVATLQEQTWKARQVLKSAGIDADEREGIIADYSVGDVVDIDRLTADYPAPSNQQRSALGDVADKADPVFHTKTTAQGALQQVEKTGTAFETLLAERLIPMVRGVSFTAVTENPVAFGMSKGWVYNKLRKARGVFFGVDRSIYVWGANRGDTHQGVNNKTVLHESVHASTVRKIALGVARISPDSKITRLVQDMLRIMDDVNATRGDDTFGLPQEAFTDVREFAAYGITEPPLQNFMMSVKGKRKSLYSRFVAAIRQSLGIDSKHQSAFTDLLDVTDQLMSAQMTVAERTMASNDNILELLKRSFPEQALSNAAAANTAAIDKMKKNPRDVGATVSAWKTLINSRSNGEFGEVVGIMANAVPNTMRSVFLGAMDLDQIRIRADTLDNTQFSSKIDNIVSGIRNMTGERNTMLAGASTIMQPWETLTRKTPEVSRRLARVMHLATINGIDPDTADGRKASPTLAALWDALGADTEGSAKDIYRKAREFYKNAYMQYQQLLEDNINSSGLDAEAKSKSISALKKEFERQKMAVPYFPLMREGRFWFKSGSGKNTEYYMFESQVQRDLFVRQYMKDANKTGSLSDIFSAVPGEFEQGNSYQQLYDSFGKSSKLLQDMLAAIDSSTKGDKASLKDSVYQVFLTTLPERSFRKQFVHRKNTPGFSGDALRNFVRSSFRMSSQLSRLKYGNKLLNNLEEMKGVTKGDPEKPVLDDYIKEVADRVEHALHPEIQNGLGDKAADIANQASFLWYLTSPASAITNMASLPVMAAPVLNANFNSSYFKVAATMGHYGKMLLSMKGMKSPDGKTYTYPSLYHALTGTEKAAFDTATAKGILSQTLVADLAGMSQTPSENYTGTWAAGMRVAGSMFHASEKAMREIAFMSAYRLAKDQTPTISEDKAIERAERALFESLGDFAATSRARYFRHPLARVMFQFKSFSKMATFYLIHNTMELTRGDPALRKAAITKLLGTLGMTGLFAGVTGMPLYSAIMFAFEKAFNLLKDDDEPELDAKLAFREWLADTLNSKFVASMVARGPISTISDIDVHSRVKLDDLWFRDVRQSKDEADWLRNFITDQLGPTVGLGINAAEAMKLIGSGHADRALERISPAILKNLFVANRYSREGVLSLKGDVVFAEDEIGAADIWKQAFGFAPNRVADLNQANIAVKGMEVRIKATKQALLTELTNDLEKSKDVSDVMEDIMNFNRAYPASPITSASIQQSLKRRMENSAMAKRGLSLSKPFQPLMEKAEYARPD